MVMQSSVSSISILFMFISAALAILVPIGLIIWLAVKKLLNVKAMLIGASFFVLFAMILESVMHYFVLGMNGGQSVIAKNPIIYGLYGGLAAGIFEETARLLGFKLVVRDREHESLNTPISYGLGHGGIEAILIGGLAMVGSIINSFMINSGAMGTIIKSLPADQAQTATQSVNALISTPSYLFLISGFERLIALIIQVSLTMFVFKAIVERKWIYYIFAIVIHAAIDFPAALLQAGLLKNVAVVEGIALACALLTAFAAYKIRPAFGGKLAASTESSAESLYNSAAITDNSADNNTGDNG